MTAGRAASLAADDAALLAAWPFRAAPPPPGTRPRKVLILGYAAIGDLIFLLPALSALRRGLPEARLVFVGDRDLGATELLPETGLVDEISLWEHARLARPADRRELARWIAAGGFDAAVAAHGTPLRAFARPLLGIPLRVGQCRPLEAPHAGWPAARYALWRLRRAAITSEFERRLCFNRKLWLAEEREHMARRNLRLAEALGCDVAPELSTPPALPERASDRAFAERALAPLAGRPVVGLHLGSPATQYEKLWPAERWAEVARGLAREKDAGFVLVGGPDEAPAAARFRAAFGGDFVDLVGRARLLESFAAIRRCALFLSSDTGPGKAALALRVPTLSVWGPVSRRDNGVFWDPELHAEVCLGLPCSPCVRLSLPCEGSGVINFSNCGHHDCLVKLESGLVLRELLARHGGRLRPSSPRH